VVGVVENARCSEAAREVSQGSLPTKLLSLVLVLLLVVAKKKKEKEKEKEMAKSKKTKMRMLAVGLLGKS
jgi:hypothetical protein